MNKARKTSVRKPPPTTQTPISVWPGLGERLGCGRTKAYELVSKRLIGSLRIGSRIFVTPEQLECYLQKQQVPAFDAKSAARELLRGERNTSKPQPPAA